MIIYKLTRIDQSEDPLIYFALFSDCDPTGYEETIKDSKQQKAMDE